MTRSPDQRLDAVEDDLEVVKQLLASAARYAQSANEGLDGLTEKQDRTQLQLDGLTEKQDRTQLQLDGLTEKQDRTQLQLDGLAVKVDELTAAQAQSQNRLDEFIFQSQRLLTQQVQRLNQVDGLTESLTAIVQRLDRNYEAQQAQLQSQAAQFQEFQRTTNAALERIDRILDYLLREQRGSNN